MLMRRTLFAALCVLMLAAGWNGPAVAQDVEAPAPGPVTLGDFAVRVVTGLGLQPAGGTVTPEGAAWLLLQKGIRIRPELDTPLTEADAVAVINGLGYKIRTVTPSRVMSRDRMEILVGAFVRKPAS